MHSYKDVLRHTLLHALSILVMCEDPPLLTFMGNGQASDAEFDFSLTYASVHCVARVAI